MAEPQKFAILKRARRIWAVGAIHGESDRLIGLHDVLAERFEPPGDRLIYLGNYLGRGPNSAATIAELLDFRRRDKALPGKIAADDVYLHAAQEEM